MMLANYLVKRLLPRSGLTIAEDAATAWLTEWHEAESTTNDFKDLSSNAMLLRLLLLLPLH